MAVKIKSEGGKGAGPGPAPSLVQINGQPLPEPAAPRDVPQPLAELPPERVEQEKGRNRTGKPGRAELPMGAQEFRQGLTAVKETPREMSAPDHGDASLLAKVETRSSRANRRKV